MILTRINTVGHQRSLLKRISVYVPNIQVLIGGLLMGIMSCSPSSQNTKQSEIQTQDITAKTILGNPEFPAISYSGYRDTSRSIQPTIEELKEDMKLLSALGIKVLRTYDTKSVHAKNVLSAIRNLRLSDPSFEMYVMLGAWINCKGASTPNPDHSVEDTLANSAEIERAVRLAVQYPEIVKIIAVGNEAMVKWAASYYVQPGVILKWVNHLQELKQEGILPPDLWITSSDNFASWGGGDNAYHVSDLESLINAVDYISLHTYPMHDTHYNPDFWGTVEKERGLPDTIKIQKAMKRAVSYAKMQYASVKRYVTDINPDKSLHIGETGWASSSNGHYGSSGSKATDEYKAGLYYEQMRSWTDSLGVSCFFFEAFDEIWKDADNPEGSENHFGLFDVTGKAKYALWQEVDNGTFKGLTRGGNNIKKTFEGELDELFKTVDLPPTNTKLNMIE